MEKSYTEQERQLDVFAEVDVLVVGGGPAGVSAAVGAARAGANTMIVEALGSFGGMWTNGLVITLAGFNSWLEPYQRCVGGVAGEWIRRASILDGAEDNRSWALSSDPEIMKLIADEILMGTDVRCLLHTNMVDTIVEDGIVKGVIIENVDGRSVIFAKAVIDSTGNGDVFARAGVEFDIYENLQPMTMPFFINDVDPPGDAKHDDEVVLPIGDKPGLLTDPILTEYASRRHDINIDHRKLKSASRSGELPRFGGPWFGGLRKRNVWVNTTRVYGSAVVSEELTRAEIQGRKDAHALMNFYRKNMKGFENAYLNYTSPVIGVRETRRMAGVYTLSGDDLRNQTQFEDGIALGVWPIDIHPSEGQTGIHAMYVPVPYQIPFRSLLPKKIDQLVVSGRCISMDREALGSVRVGATCAATGHAAGVSAAISALSGDKIRSLDYQLIKDELEAQSAVLAL